jgi:hypothetical protein
MLRSTTAPKAASVAERDMRMENRAGVFGSYLAQVAPEAVRLGSPEKIRSTDDSHTLI